MKRQACRGAGVDCVRFGACVLDELYGDGMAGASIMPEIPQDAAWHNRRAVMRVVRLFQRIYPVTKVVDDVVEPGDVVIVGPRAGGPAHVLIAGVRQLWHAIMPAVAPTGLTFSRDMRLFRIYRPQEKHRWIS